jgi:hypothetical protein
MQVSMENARIQLRRRIRLQRGKDAALPEEIETNGRWQEDFEVGSSRRKADLERLKRGMLGKKCRKAKAKWRALPAIFAGYDFKADIGAPKLI